MVWFRRKKEIKLVGFKAEREELLRQMRWHQGSSIYQRDRLQFLSREIAKLEEELEPIKGGFKWLTSSKSSKTNSDSTST